MGANTLIIENRRNADFSNLYPGRIFSGFLPADNSFLLNGFFVIVPNHTDRWFRYHLLNTLADNLLFGHPGSVQKHLIDGQETEAITGFNRQIIKNIANRIIYQG